MSPEQARGQDVDKRSDIWAFGCVLFAMLTGRTPFDGDTLSDVIAATLTTDPDWNALPPDLPEPIRRVLQRCLHRDLRHRLRDIGDARARSRRADHGLAAHPESRRLSIGLVPASHRSRRRQRVAGSLSRWPDGRVRRAGLGTTADLDPDAVGRRTAARHARRWRSRIPAMDERTAPPSCTSPGLTDPASRACCGRCRRLAVQPRPLVASVSGGDCSHDGRRIALFHTRDDRAELVTYARDDGRIERLALGPLGCMCQSPRWSPDDRWIVFHTRGIGRFNEHLHIVPTSGAHEPVLIARAAAIRGVAWLPDSSGVVYGSSAGSTVPYPPTFNLRRVNRDGTDDRALTFGDVVVRRSGRARLGQGAHLSHARPV